MSKDYNILAKYITKKYVDRISGNDIDGEIIGDDPAKRVMVGLLSEDRVDLSFSGTYVENTNTKFESVPSLSISFIVKKNPSGILRIIPRGLLFYCVKPNYEETRDYLLNLYSEKDKTKYQNIDAICEVHPDERLPFPLTYKSINLENVFGEGIEISLDELNEGSFHHEKEIKKYLNELSEEIFPEIAIVQSTHISLADMLDEDRFNRVCIIKDESASPRWNIDILRTVVEQDDSWRILLQMVNKTPIGKTDARNIGYIPKIFNAGMSVVGNPSIQFIEIPLDSFKNSFKSKPSVFVISENTSAKYIEKDNAIVTENVPIFYQYRLKTKDDFNHIITFDSLIENPVENLYEIKQKMEEDYAEREAEFRSISNLTPVAKEKYEEALFDYRHEIDRFELGIQQIEYKDFVKRAFLYMNETFRLKFAKEQRPISGWRLFQIVFIVSIIPDIILSEYKEDKHLQNVEQGHAHLLYFPTGGGKTEAFLGITVFNIFFDRLRGKNEGITSIIKYPLRLLAVQQLDRVLTIIMKANAVKRTCNDIKDTTDFRVGFYVGKTNTPNKISPQETLSERGSKGSYRNKILDSDEETLNEYYRFIDTCPVCGEKTITVSFNRERWVLEHRCSNPNCQAGVLPLFIVDNEIYRYLPSVVVSTIDKMALLGNTNEFKMLFGQVKKKCPVHGFTHTSKCLAPKCAGFPLEDVGLLKDPVPTLFIQDELHLVKESLGTFDSHYESFIQNYAKNLVPESQRKQIRFVGATATIAMYNEHIHNLYHKEARRFPCEYPSMESGEDFYSYTDIDDITRIILGYAPYGRSITDGMWESVYIMRLVIHGLFNNEDAYHTLCQNGFAGSFEDYNNMLYDYWIDLVYNNRKQDAMELENAFKNQGNNFLEEKGVPKFEVEQMTSDTDFQAVRKALFDIQANRKNLDSTNLLLATRTISHGVDEDSFNIMYFFGMPNNNAEYIQAYSRTGRKYTGIVIDIIRLMRIRDRSYLKNFIVFHQNKEDLVESVPINRWAKNAIYNTLPGMLSGILMQYYTLQTGEDSLYHTSTVKKLLRNGSIDIDDVIEKLVMMYDCNPQEKPSQEYEGVISKEVRNILSSIETGTFPNSEQLSTSIARFSHGRKGPMTSLRDTEEQIEISVGMW